MRKLALTVLALALALGSAAAVGCAKKAPADTPKAVDDANTKAKAALSGAPVAGKSAPATGGK